VRKARIARERFEFGTAAVEICSPSRTWKLTAHATALTLEWPFNVTLSAFSCEFTVAISDGLIFLVDLCFTLKGNLEYLFWDSGIDLTRAKNCLPRSPHIPIYLFKSSSFLGRVIGINNVQLPRYLGKRPSPPMTVGC